MHRKFGTLKKKTAFKKGGRISEGNKAAMCMGAVLNVNISLFPSQQQEGHNEIKKKKKKKKKK